MSGGEHEIHAAAYGGGGGGEGFAGPNVGRLRAMRQQAQQFARHAGAALSPVENWSVAARETIASIANGPGE